MAAYLTVYGPKDGGRSVTLQGLIAKLKEAGVVEGIDFGNVAECLKDENWNRPQLVARGTAPRDGIDGRLEYRFIRPNQKAKPVELEDGRLIPEFEPDYQCFSGRVTGTRALHTMEYLYTVTGRPSSPGRT
jgi:uncharacterized protein (DUF342 family)